MSGVKEIYDGWKNLVWKDKEVEKLAKTRAEICGKCYHNKLGVCVLCGCVLSAKVRSKESMCKINLW